MKILFALALALCSWTVTAQYQLGVPRGLYMYRSPGVSNLASAATIVIDLGKTNTPIYTLTNNPAHNISVILSNPAPGRQFTFYAQGNGLATNNSLTWSAVAGVHLRWPDATTNSSIRSNGFTVVSGFVTQTAGRTNLFISHRDE